MREQALYALARYGVKTGLIMESDVPFVLNRFLAVLGLDGLTEEDQGKDMALKEALGILLDDAAARGVMENTITHRDLLDTALMGEMTPFPSTVILAFEELYHEDPKKATDWFYDFCQNTDYIRRYRIAKDVKWQTKTAYGDLDITINLSKPEKDPKAIAAAKTAPQTGYPKCMLCRENEGYAGRINHPARQNHRVIPITIDGKDWFFQYSPYVYYNEHCIAFNGDHVPMKIDRSTFLKMLDFVEIFPHYFIGSNADLPIVGGSILSHDHFQGGHYTFAMEKAPIQKPVTFAKFPTVTGGIVHWPMSVLRLQSKNRADLVDLADEILQHWRTYTDEAAFIFAETDGEPHNTITPIARKKGDMWELDLVLRNNITTDEHPLGVYHPHEELHHIKKENIGLIEVMGLAVLPARLKEELQAVKEGILSGADLTKDSRTEKHAAWAAAFAGRVTAENADRVIQEEVGLVFSKVLEDAGVYKQTAEGQAAFLRFVASCGGKA